MISLNDQPFCNKTKEVFRYVRFGTLNCQSICNKTDEVLGHILNTDIDLCFLQETFMSVNDTAILNEVKSLGLKMLSVSRDKGIHGGLGLIYLSK